MLDDYDVTKIDVLVFGGMVPAETKQHLRAEIGKRNPQVTFVQGLAGIAGLIAAQVEEAVAPSEPGDGRVTYDTSSRCVDMQSDESAHVSIQAWWHTSFTPPEPGSTSMQVFNGELHEGLHRIALPDTVPFEASFVTVAIGSSVRAFPVGAMPKAVTRMVPTSSGDRRLSGVRHVTTRSDDQ